MNKILLFIVIGFVISSTELEDIIIIGDSRIEEMSTVLLGLGYTEYYYPYANRWGILTKEPLKYNDYNIHITATGFIDPLIKSNNNDVYNNVLNQLKKAKHGTNVLINLGIDNLDEFNPIVVFIGKLADKFPNLNFQVISIVGVNEGFCRIKNSSIKEFNQRMKSRIEIVEFPNVKYRSILHDENPTQIIVDGKVVEILNYASEGTGFFKTGYTKFFRALVENL